MPEPTLPNDDALNGELETLRRVNAELLAKRAKDKARISELESTVTGLQGTIVERDDAIHEITIGGPLKTMAESISTAPDLFLEQFSKYFKLEMANGSFALLSHEGKPITSKDGKAIPFEREALIKFLTGGDDARAKTFKALTIVSRATGAGGTNHQRANFEPTTKPNVHRFGLR